MSDDSRKPDADAMPFSAQDAMAFMQRMWNPFSMPMPGAAPPSPATGGATADPAAAGAPAGAPGAEPAAGGATSFGAMPGMLPGMLPFPNPATMFAALDPAEVARKIDELKVIEGWLAMSLNLVQMSIRTLELQLASLEALHGAHAPAGRKRSRRSPTR